MKRHEFLLCVCLVAAISGGVTFGQSTNEVSAAEEARAAKLHETFSQFPLLTPVFDHQHKPDFQTAFMTNPVMIDGDSYTGFRFTVPPREHNEDFVWAFVGAGRAYEWWLLPQSGVLCADVNFLHVSKAAYMGTNQLLPLGQRDLILQSFPGEALKDGETYLAWWTFPGRRRKESVEFTFASLTTKQRTNEATLRKVLGLGRTSDAIVSPVNHHTYILLKASTWRKAEERAVALGGHLATVRSQAEEDWLFKTFGKHGGEPRLLWIGLSDRDKKFHFTWSSGESVSYTAWAKGEPNNAGRGEDFVAIYYPGHKQGGKWNDWGDRTADPIGLPINGVVEIVPPAANEAEVRSTESQVSRVSAPAAGAGTGTAAVGALGLGDNLQAVLIAPNLVITNDSGSIKLQWPVQYSGYMLEATTDLTSPFTMFGYSELTNEQMGFVYVTITNPLPQMFFRLRKP